MQRFRHVRFLARRLCSGSLNEFRHNLATDEWVVFSSARRSRPTQIVSNDLKAPQISLLGAHDVNCPFCKGNEHLTPPATYTRYERGTKDWIMRVVPNKFPAVSPASPSSPPRVEAVAAGDPYLQFTVDRIEATGFHEVLIEGPAHNVPTALASPSQVESLVRGLRSRGRSMIASDSSLRHIMYFKNSGLKAGASLLHPHSQVLGLPLVPNEVVRRQRHAREWFLRFQRNVFEHTIEETLRERDQAIAAKGGAGNEAMDPAKHRVILEDEMFVCFVPFAALSPYSLWIVPKLPAAHFHEAPDDLLRHFAKMLRQALRKLHFGLGEPDFNMVIRSAALERKGHAIYRSELFFRWYCLIVPRLGVGAMGGFEFSTGIQSHSSLPEDDAAYLRTVEVPEG